MTSRWTVVKVGGSLFDLPDLRDRLRSWLAALDAGQVLLVPGGGATTSSIRALDQAHCLGEEVSHWLAIQALSVNARFLHALLLEARLLTSADQVQTLDDVRLAILDPFPFFHADECRRDHLPHHWQVTSDSLSARAAALMRASSLILLKSVAWEGQAWQEAARSGIVDDYFPVALQQSPDLRVQIIDLRAFEHFG
jgi:aspartokinase-like uncharacterized kinase